MTFPSYVRPGDDPLVFAEMAASLKLSAEHMRTLSVSENWRWEADEPPPPSVVARLDQIAAELVHGARMAEQSAASMARYGDAILRNREHIARAQAFADELQPVQARIAHAMASMRTLTPVIDDVARLARLYARKEYPGHRVIAAYTELNDEWRILAEVVNGTSKYFREREVAVRGRGHLTPNGSADASSQIQGATEAEQGSTQPTRPRDADTQEPRELPMVSYDSATQAALSDCANALSALAARHANDSLHTLKQLLPDIRTDNPTVAWPDDDHAIRMVLWGSLTQSGSPWDLTEAIESLIGSKIGQQVWGDNQYLPLAGTPYALHYRAWMNTYYGYIGTRLGQNIDDLLVLRVEEPDDRGDRIGVFAGQRISQEPLTAGMVTETLLTELDVFVDACRRGVSRHLRRIG